MQFLAVFRGLFSAFRSQALGQAYGHAIKVFQDVENGKEINPSDLLETCRYRVALEMCRVRMNKLIRDSATKVYNQIPRSDYLSVAVVSCMCLYFTWFYFLFRSI